MKINMNAVKRESNPYVDRIVWVRQNIEQVLKTLQQENIDNMQNILNGNLDKYWDRVKKYQQEFQRRVAKILDIS